MRKSVIKAQLKQVLAIGILLSLFLVPAYAFGAFIEVLLSLIFLFIMTGVFIIVIKLIQSADDDLEKGG